MGINTNTRRRRRARRRALASFASFLLLFAFTLGQSSISALAGGAGADPFPEPGIDVEKSCPESVPFGEDVDYTITVTNTGEEPLIGVYAKDTLLGDITAEFDFDFSNPFPVGGIATAVVSYTPQPGDPDPIINIVHVHGFGASAGGTKVTDNATCTTDLTLEPGIDVVKECPDSVSAGEDVVFTITVTNTGSEPLENLFVTDALLGGNITAAFNFPNPFPVGDSASADFTYTPGANEDPVENSVSASGDGVDSGATATASDSCDTDITHQPGIGVEKECPESVPAGEDVVFTITVTNTGNEPLENLVVTDALLGGNITAAFNFPNPFPVGDSASADFTYTPGASEDPVENSVTASGDGVDSGATATASDSCDTDITQEPEIDVTKSCTPLAHVGDTVTYTITVTNTGTEDLTNVTVVDTILGDLSTSFADDLAVSASESHDFDYVVQESDPDPLVNDVTATGLGVQSESPVDDTAQCATDLIHPAIEIVKTVDEETVPIGTTVTYTYVVTNTGDTTLYDISVDDDILGHIGDIDVLEPGQSATLTKDFVVGAAPVTNVATAEGEDILGRVVSATDAVVVTPIGDVNPGPGPDPDPDPTPPPAPFTGSGVSGLGLVMISLLGIGATLVAVTRRRRTEDGTA